MRSFKQAEGRREKRVDTTMAGEPLEEDFPRIISDEDPVYGITQPI